MNIYLLRHCESLFNENETNDLINCSLSRRGIEQAKQINLNSIEKQFNLVICSPLYRSIQTFIYSTLSFQRLEVNNLFREIYLGCKSDLLHENESISIDTDESIRQRLEQIQRFLVNLKQFNYENVLIVTHADLVWNLTSREFDGETFGQWLQNGEVFFWKQI